jgi:hypothetical protein
MHLRETARGGLSRFAHLAGLGSLARAASASDLPDPRQEPTPQPAPQPDPAPAQPVPGTPAQPGQDDGGSVQIPTAPANAPSGVDGSEGDEEPNATASAFVRGFAAAQARAAAILGHAAAAGNMPLAAELACGNSLPTRQALALLEAGSVARQAPAAPQRASLDDRMRGQATRGAGPDAGAEPAKDTPQAAAASILAAFAKATGKKG